MEEKALHELLEGQAHRPLFRLAPWALGPLGIPKDHLLAIAGREPAIGQGPAAQVAG
jgi:hypothetical protein